MQKIINYDANRDSQLKKLQTWAKMENAAAIPTAPIPTIVTLWLDFGSSSSVTVWKSSFLSDDILGSIIINNYWLTKIFFL